MDQFTSQEYDVQKEGSLRSAEVIVPLILKMLPVTSVVDVGCGVGSWLRVFGECGVKDVVGIDGYHVASDQLRIPPDTFIRHDLKEPFPITRRFDLVMSLEVAEHLPESSASQFVDTLSGLGSVILFSAAVPHQGGFNHLNEQWPDYWARHFAKRGYVAVDCLRHPIWSDDRVRWWYAQNLLLFVEQTHLRDMTLESTDPHDGRMLSLIHPRLYLQTLAAADLRHVSVPSALRVLRTSIARALRRRLRRVTGYPTRADA